MTTQQTVEAVRDDLYQLDCFVEARGRGRTRVSRLVHRRSGRLLVTGSGVRTREDLLRSFLALAPARDFEYERWAEDLDATLPPVTSQG